MALMYKGVQSTLADKNGKKLYYPRLVKVGKVVDTLKLAELIAEKASLTPGDVQNTITNLMSVMREQLLNSKSVRLEGLGTFTLIAKANGKGVEKAEDVDSSQITRLTCRFTPEYKKTDGSNYTRAMFSGGVEYIRLDRLAKGYSVDAEEAGEGGGNGSNSGSGSGNIDGES